MQTCDSRTLTSHELFKRPLSDSTCALTFAAIASTRSSGRRSEVIHADDLACSGEQIASCAPLTLNEDVDLIAVHPLAAPSVPDPAHNLLLGRSQNIGCISDHREPRFLDPSPLIGFSH